MIITIYRENETIELEDKKLVGKDFPSNTVIDFKLPSGEVIKIRPYYRYKSGGVLNVFCEEEVNI